MDQPLSEKEFDQLSAFLQNIGPPALNLEAVDGLFCALICGPEVVLPSEYLPEIWGENFVSEDRDEAAFIFGLLMRHWNTIARTLQGALTAPDVYMPVLFVSDDGVTRANDWAQGFMRGAMIRPAFWLELIASQEHGGSILPMLLLSHEHDPDPKMRPGPIPPEKREDILLQMIAGLTKIYRHFEPLRRSVPGGLQASAHMQRRTGTKTGRNDPCPCGSGQKYKRCCAMAAPNVH